MNSARTAVICDDDPVMRSVLSSLLVDVGYEVVGTADTAIRAIELVDSAHPDLVIVDVAMPGMSGLEAIPVLRRVSPGAAIIVCSAFDVSEASALASGAIAVIDKAKLVDLTRLLTPAS